MRHSLLLKPPNDLPGLCPARKYLGISVPFPPGKVKVKFLRFHTILIVFFCFFIHICSGIQQLCRASGALLCAEAPFSVQGHAAAPRRLSHSSCKAASKSMRGASAAAHTGYSPCTASPHSSCALPTVCPRVTGASSTSGRDSCTVSCPVLSAGSRAVCGRAA